MAHDLVTLKTCTPEEKIIGQAPDISEYKHFPWF
jgi:hypothetical protein